MPDIKEKKDQNSRPRVSNERRNKNNKHESIYQNAYRISLQYGICDRDGNQEI
jgi:hypothetical protein